MTLKQTITTLAVALTFNTAFAQGNNSGMGGERENTKSLYQMVSGLQKKNDKFNVHIDFAGSYKSAQDAETGRWTNNIGSRHFRINFQGNITNKISYRFRYVADRNEADKNGIDGFLNTTDFMFLTYKFNEHHSITAGKLAQAWGTYEFDANPLNIYQYCDFLQFGSADLFITGIQYAYRLNQNHEFLFQVTNAFSNSYEKTFDRFSKEGIKDYEGSSNAPFAYVVGWNGTMFDGMLKTRWGGGMLTESQDNKLWFLGLGQKLDLGNFQATFDYLHESDGLDRLRIASNDAAEILDEHNLAYFRDTEHNTFIGKLEFQPAEKWNIWAQGVYETVSVKENETFGDQFEDYRKSYGYSAGVEYKPFADQDLKLFGAYMGRRQEFSDKSGLSAKNNNMNRVEVGFMYHLNIF